MAPQRDPKVAVVTGGSAGLGWSIGQRLVADGFTVIAADLNAGNTTGPDGPSDIIWKPLDVTDPVATKDFFEQITATYGRLDALVNNAGIQFHSPIENLGWDSWRAVVDVNLHGVFNCLQQGGRQMLATGGGSIVNISSVGARGAAGRAPYSATKAAVIALTATAGAEWAARGVRVNAVAPGYIDTGVMRAGVADGSLNIDTILARIPAKRLADGSEIADAVAFLIGDQSRYMNGQTLWVDGGFIIDYGIPLSVAKPDPGGQVNG